MIEIYNIIKMTIEKRNTAKEKIKRNKGFIYKRGGKFRLRKLKGGNE